MADDTIVNMFWHGPRLPPLAWACMCSFLERGHQLRVFSYEHLVIPSGAIAADAREVIPYLGALQNHEAIAGFSDLFRYSLLHKYGGWWADTDVFCLTSKLPPEPYAWAEQEPGEVNGAILKFPRGDRLCGQLLKRAERKSRKGFSWGSIGPDLLTSHVSKRTDLLRSGTTPTFYPWNWREAFLIWYPKTKQQVIQKARDALFLHFWDFALRNMGMDAFRDPPPGSFWADIIAGAPNRLAGDAEYFCATDVTIQGFCEKHWPAQRWEAYLQSNPELFSGLAA